MKREEAIETVDAVDYFGMSTDHKVELSKAFVNKIYDDFESRTCESCKYWNRKNPARQDGDCDEINHTNTETDWNFGCNKWEEK
jgi:hypothetical protein